MKKLGLFLVLFGAVYLIYKIWAYSTGVISQTSLIFGVLLSIYLIFSGLDKIYSWEQTRPKLYKYAVIIFGTLTVIFFIVALVHAYLSRG
jgi:uncharacterized membrane protein HdeD (DUF308 family)